MKKIVLITGSPRKKGNSNCMANSFEKAALKKGMDVARFDATAMKINGCLACNQCYSKEQACYFDYDFDKIANELINADGIVISSPVYWYTFPAQIKAVIDKFYAIYSHGHTFEGKKCGLISCCEEENKNTFTGIEFAFDKTFELMKCENVGKVLIPGVVEVGDIEKTDGEKKAAALVELFK